MTPEGKVKAEIRAILDSLGVWYFCPTMKGWGRTGIPDFIVCHRGKFIAIEAKAAGKEPNTNQTKELADIEKHGGLPIVTHPEDVQYLSIQIRYWCGLLDGKRP